MAEPPSDVEPVKLKDACPLPGTTSRPDGALGADASGILDEVAETTPSPALVTAISWYLGELAPLSPEIVIGEVVLPAEVQLDQLAPLSVVERYL
jgi:hypothetical protein